MAYFCYHLIVLYKDHAKISKNYILSKPLLEKNKGYKTVNELSPFSAQSGQKFGCGYVHSIEMVHRHLLFTQPRLSYAAKLSTLATLAVLDVTFANAHCTQC
jgi:hypothetical protein